MYITTSPNFELLSKKNRPEILSHPHGYTLLSLQHIENLENELSKLEAAVNDLYEEIVKIKYSFVGTTRLMFDPVKSSFDEEIFQTKKKCQNLYPFYQQTYVSDKSLLEAEITLLYKNARETFNLYKTTISLMQDFYENYSENKPEE